MYHRSLEGIVDKLRSDRLVDGVSLDNIDDSDDDDSGGKHQVNMLPGGGSGQKNDGSRLTKPEILTTCIKFSSTGTEWAAATTQGLQVLYVLLYIWCDSDSFNKV